jgi:hypothetical protein
MPTYRSAISSAEPLAFAQASIIVSEFTLNPHESFRAEIIDRQGKTIVAIGRWKISSAGAKRTGVAFEFAAHRIPGIAKIIRDLQRAFVSMEGANDPT